jgi:hypothetical protein
MRKRFAKYPNPNSKYQKIENPNPDLNLLFFWVHISDEIVNGNQSSNSDCNLIVK